MEDPYRVRGDDDILRLVAAHRIPCRASTTLTDCAILLPISNRLQERLTTDETRSESPSYVIVEKILAVREDLPEDWPVSGTTGYDYTNQANGIFVNPEGARQIQDIYSNYIGRRQDFSDVLYQKKKLVMIYSAGCGNQRLGLDTWRRSWPGARSTAMPANLTAPGR